MKKVGILFTGLAMVLASCTNESLNERLQSTNSDRVSSLDEATVIDFEGFVAGDIVSEVTSSDCDGVISIFGVNPDFPGVNAAMAFDSSNPTGSDVDLGTPNEMYGGPGISNDGPQPSNDTELGMLLILSEDMDSSDPDDSVVAGSRYEFDFSGYGNGSVTLHGFTMIDLESPGVDNLPTVVTLYDGLDNILFQMEVPYSDDNAVQFINLEDTEGVVGMVLELNNSGAIDNLTLTCGDEEIEIGECETMFAKADDELSTCFIEDDFNRWGWTNGPLSSGTYTMDIYAGAGQCNTDNGALAGTVTLEYDADTGEAIVTYETNDDFVLTETHLYIGEEPYPLKQRGRNGLVPTVAPGQYPYQHGDLENVSEDTYTISDLSGEIYIIAHGVVCEVID